MRWSFEKQRLLCVGEDTRPESRQDRSTPASWTGYNIRQHGQWIERNILLQTRRWFGNIRTIGAVSDSPYLWPARILRCLHGSDQSNYGLNNSVRGRDVESDISNREQGLRSGESARLLPTWPGFDTGPVLYVGWVCCWFSSLLRGFFSGFSGFPHSTKNQHSKFQFDLETVDEEPIHGICHCKFLFTGAHGLLDFLHKKNLTILVISSRFFHFCCLFCTGTIFLWLTDTAMWHGYTKSLLQVVAIRS